MKQRRKSIKLSRFLPPSHSDTVTAVFHAAMQKLGITDVKSYYARLRIPIIVCAVLGAAIGAADYGFKGLLLGALLGFTAPAVFILVCVTLVVVGLLLAVYCAAWAVILYVLWWLLSAMFGS